MDLFKDLKSDYFLQKLYDYLQKNKFLKIIKYNKNIQKRVNLDVNSYKECCEKYSSIEIEIIPNDNRSSRFINRDIDKEKGEHYHIYFNDNKEKEIKKNFLKKDDGQISKINIIIDFHIDNFNKLFYYCDQINSISFKKFFRNNILDMSQMFEGCALLKEINFANFKTNGVTNMSKMFKECQSLTELNLSNFNTNNATDMSYMFKSCISLTDLNLSNFNTNNVTDMSYMFENCKSLKKLNVSSFNIDRVTIMVAMFFYCSSLEDINLFNINENNKANMSSMFDGCSDNFKTKMKSEVKNIKEEAFEEFDF